MEEKLTKAPIATRGIALLTDYFLCFFASIIIVLIKENFNNNLETIPLLKTYFGNFSSTPIFYILLVFKDVLSGKSIGKRWVKLTVRNYDDPTCLPSLWRLVVRNVFLIVWPIEYLVMIINKENRRFGDILAGTDVFKEDN